MTLLSQAVADRLASQFSGFHRYRCCCRRLDASCNMERAASCAWLAALLLFAGGCSAQSMYTSSATSQSQRTEVPADGGAALSCLSDAPRCGMAQQACCCLIWPFVCCISAIL